MHISAEITHTLTMRERASERAALQFYSLLLFLLALGGCSVQKKPFVPSAQTNVVIFAAQNEAWISA
jgi:hypothetical protein